MKSRRARRSPLEPPSTILCFLELHTKRFSWEGSFGTAFPTSSRRTRFRAASRRIRGRADTAPQVCAGQTTSAWHLRPSLISSSSTCACRVPSTLPPFLLCFAPAACTRLLTGVLYERRTMERLPRLRRPSQSMPRRRRQKQRSHSQDSQEAPEVFHRQTEIKTDIRRTTS